MSKENSGSSISVPSDRTPERTDGSEVNNLPLDRSELRTVLKRLHSDQTQTVSGPRLLGRSENSNQPDLQIKKVSMSETDLMITCIGFSVGIGNIWRFPYVAFKNGGGAFLIPYLIVTFLISVPLYYMELVIGQCSKLDPVRVWCFCPFFQGLGFTIILCTLFIQLYYNVIMSYAFFYLLQTFRYELPWSGCLKWWGADENCHEMEKGIVPCSRYLLVKPSNCTNNSEVPGNQFWKKYVLGISSGLDNPGTIKWDLTVVLLTTWVIICALVISRHHTNISIKFKTVYFTALFPFLVLAIYLIYVATLPGAVRGLRKLFIPKWSALLDIKVWADATETSMFSTGLGLGGLTIFGRQKDFRYDISKCAYISCTVDLITSVFAAAVTFMTVGFLAERFGVEFSDSTLQGYGLVFVTYPHAALKMGIPHLWAFLFFLMLFFLAMDTAVAMTETVFLGIAVHFCPLTTHSKIYVVLLCVFFFMTGLPCVTNGGAFVVDLLDQYAGGHGLMGTLMFEAIAFGWGFGVKGGFKNIENVLESKISIFMKLCWIFVAPVALIVLFINSASGSYLWPVYGIPYPSYADVIGWCIVAVILSPIPIFMVIVLIRNGGNVSKALEPGKLWKQSIGQR